MIKMIKKSLTSILCVLGLSVMLGACGSRAGTAGQSGNNATAESAASSGAEGESNARAEDAAKAAEESKVSRDAAAAGDEKNADSAAEAAKENADWTVLVYMTGANELDEEEAYATDALRQFAATKQNDHVNLVVETGACKKWYTEDELGFEIAADKLQRYALEDGSYSLIEEEELKSMGASQTLSEFIQWGSANYPADKYMLFIYAHGGGSLSGLIFDEQFDNDALSLEEFETALADGGTMFEAIYMQTCLMASLETAQALAPYTNYYLASEEVAYALDYQSSLQYLYDNPTVNGANFGKMVCDAYQTKYAQYTANALTSSTFSVIDESKIDAVALAFNQAAGTLRTLLEQDPDEFRMFAIQAAQADRYEEATMIDLLDFAVKTRGYGLSEEDTNALINSVRDAVLYQHKGNDHAFSGGLSFYYNPTADEKALDHYARNCKNAQYLGFLDQINYTWTAPAWVYEQVEKKPEIRWDDYQVEVAVEKSEEDRPMLRFVHGKSGIAAIENAIFQYDERRDTWMYLGMDAEFESDFDEDTFEDNFDGTWLSVNGVVCQANIASDDENGVVYDIPFQFDEDTELGTDGYFFLRVLYSYENKTFEVIGIRKDSIVEMGNPERGVIALSELEGEKITLIGTEHKDEHSDLIGYRELGTITCTDTFTVERKTLPKGIYRYCYVVMDLFGRTQLSSADVTWDGKKAVFAF